MLSWAQQEAVKHRKKHGHVHANTQALSHTHAQHQTHYFLFLSLFVRLLDVIAGRKDPAGLKQGKVLVDGKVVTSDLRLSSAYVVQVHKYKHTHTFFDIIILWIPQNSLCLHNPCASRMIS